MLLLCFVGVVKAENLVFNAQSETALPGNLAGGQYTWVSPTITAPADFKTLRLTFGGNIGNGKDANGYPHVAIAEFYLFDKEGNRVELTTENFSSNATETNEGASGLHALCNGFDVKQDSEGDYDWYWHSYWSAGANGLHYLEINLDEVTADLSTFTFKYVTRQENGTPTELLVTTGSSSENVASQAQSSQLLFANYDLANQAFRLKSSNITDADLYMTIETPNSNDQNEGGVKILEKSVENANSQAFKFEVVDDKFYIKSESGYYLNTLSNWGFNAVGSASNDSKFEIVYVGEGEFKIKGTKGYVGPNQNYKTDHPYEMFSNHGLDKSYLDWTLEPYVVEYEVVYNYKLNGEVVKTETYILSDTEDYPNLKTAFGMTTSDAKPDGKVNANGTYDFNYTSTIPFIWETNADAISNWYTIKMHSNNKRYIKYIANGNYLSWADTEFGLGKDFYAWAFVGNPFDGFKLVNKALTGTKALKSTNSGNPSMQNFADATAFVYAQSDVAGQGYFCLKNPAGNYLNAQSGKVAHWDDNDAGSTMEVATFEYSLEESLSDLQGIYDVVDNAFGTALGQYKEMEPSFEDKLYVAFSEAGEALKSEENKEVGVISLLVNHLVIRWSELLANPRSREINLPEQGKFYRFSHNYGGEVGNLYVQAVACGVQNKANGMLMSADKDAKSIFYYADGQLLSYSKGLYVKDAGSNRGLQGVGVAGGAAKFEAGTVVGQLGIFAGDSFHANTSGDVRFIDHCGNVHGTEHNFTVEEVTSLPVTVTVAGWASFYAPVAVELPAGLKAYYVSQAQNGWATLTEISGTIPANTGVLLEGTAGSYDLTITDNVEAISGNLLAGTTPSTYIAADAYALGLVDSEVGFYIATKNQQEGASWLNNGFKAYLPASLVETTAGALRFNFGGETTAIESVLNNGVDANAPIYDLSGRRVNNAVKGGIYIQNGKKFIVK